MIVASTILEHLQMKPSTYKSPALSPFIRTGPAKSQCHTAKLSSGVSGKPETACSPRVDTKRDLHSAHDSTYSRTSLVSVGQANDRAIVRAVDTWSQWPAASWYTCNTVGRNALGRHNRASPFSIVESSPFLSCTNSCRLTHDAIGFGNWSNAAFAPLDLSCHMTAAWHIVSVACADLNSAMPGNVLASVALAGCWSASSSPLAGP